MSPIEKTLALAAIIENLESSGCVRKAAFFQIKLASVLRQQRQPELALMILERAFRPYGFDFTRKQYTRIGPNDQRTTLLKEMIDLSELHVNRRKFLKHNLLYLTFSYEQLNDADQVNVVKDMRRWIQSMHTSTTISFENVRLPLFRKLQVIRSKDRNVIVRTKARTEDSPFIYAPGNKKGDDAGDTFIAMELVQFELTLYNPYLFNIEIIVTLQSTGSSMNVESAHCLIPAQCESFAQRILATPLEAGLVTITGVEIAFLGIQMTYPIDRRGKLSHNNTFNLQVIAPQPFLSLQTLSKTLDGLFLYEGEQLQLKVSIGNTSSSPLGNVELKCNYSYNPDMYRAQILNALYINHVLPFESTHALTPKNVLLTINFRGILGCTGGTILINYQGEHQGTLVTRQLEIPIQMTVIQALTISDVLVLPFQSNLVEATEGDGKDSSMGDIVHSLNVSTNDIQDVQTADLTNHCLVSFNLSNTTERPVLLDLVDSPPLKLAPHNNRRLVVPVPQLELSSSQIDSLCQFNDFQISTFLQLKKHGEFNFPSRLVYALTKSIVDGLKFSWSSGARKGELCLHHVKLDPDSVTHLLRSDVYLSHSVHHTNASITVIFDIKVNGAWTLELQPILETEDGYLEDVHDFLESSSKSRIAEGTPSTVKYTTRVLKPCQTHLLYILTLGDINVIFSDSIRLT